VMQDVVDQGMAAIRAEEEAARAKEEARQQALREISRFMTNSTAETLSANALSIILETRAQVDAALKTGSLTVYDINKLALAACKKIYKEETGRDLLDDVESDKKAVSQAIQRQQEANALAKAAQAKVAYAKNYSLDNLLSDENNFKLSGTTDIDGNYVQEQWWFDYDKVKNAAEKLKQDIIENNQPIPLGVVTTNQETTDLLLALLLTDPRHENFDSGIQKLEAYEALYPEFESWWSDQSITLDMMNFLTDRYYGLPYDIQTQLLWNGVIGDAISNIPIPGF
jgi:hypothetical protein